MAVYTITGATGFIGEHLLKELLALGHKVNVLVRDTNFSHDSDLVTVAGFAPDEIAMAVQESDHIIHLAALYTVGQSMEDTMALVESNVLLSSLILSAIANFNPHATFVTTSTFSSLDEHGDYNPSTVYSATKTAVETMASAFKTQQTVFLRLAETYGPGDSRPKIHNLLRNTFKKGLDFEMRSPKEQIINLTHVKDVVRGLIFASENIFDNPHDATLVYDFYYPESEISLEALADIFSEHYGQKYTAPKVGNIVKMPLQAQVMPGFKLNFTDKQSILKEVLTEAI